MAPMGVKWIGTDKDYDKIDAKETRHDRLREAIQLHHKVDDWIASSLCSSQ
jgi:hypothetical protein